MTVKAEIDDEGDQPKRYEEAIAASVDEYVCPITSKLPLDPVTAEDGHIYEKAEIRRHFKANRFNIKSPVTNKRMGKRIQPASQVRNAIEKLVRSGVLRGDKAEHWVKRLRENEEMDALLDKAERGDTRAMCELGQMYAMGTADKPEDLSLAYTWFKKAADRDDVVGMAGAGYYLVHGIGVKKKVADGIILMTKAMEEGSEFATFYMGVWHCKGMHGVSRDPEQGLRLLRKVVDGECKIKNLPVEQRDAAAEAIQKLEDPSADAAEVLENVDDPEDVELSTEG